MRVLYDIGIAGYGLLLRLIAPFHAKAARWVKGRRGLLAEIAQTVDSSQEHIWFHFASLGEFEQGRSVMEEIRRQYPGEKIIITFFSPSGYDIRRNTPLADYVFYLPEDRARNARRFIDLINPKLAIFTKYEYWYHYFRELHRREIRLLMISAIFREDQLFFKAYGGFYRSILGGVSYFFTQNIDSVHMLKWIGITQAGLAGDTRFDRVVQLPQQHQPLPFIASFVGGRETFVAGSSWAPDEEMLASLVDSYGGWKFVVAPHEIHTSHLEELGRRFPQALFYSRRESYSAEDVASAQVLIIDNIGMLSALYHYGDICYIGGGFGAGIHNTLEAATYGKPVLFGPRYEKFQEATDLVTLGAAHAVASAAELQYMMKMLQEASEREAMGAAAKKYVQQRAGATQIIMKYLATEKLLG